MAFKKALSALVLALPLVTGLDACSFLVPIVTDLQTNLFKNTCGEGAHAALRLSFHDAIGFSLTSTIGGGGADGSIATFNTTELTFPQNAGIASDLADVGPFIHKYASVMTPGDLIHLAGVTSFSFCAGAPRIPFLLGRPKAKAASPPNLVPAPQQNVTVLLARMADAGFTPKELIALLASHSVAGANDIDTTIPRTPFDSTPSVFDSQFYVDVALHGTLFPGTGAHVGEVETAIAGTMRLQSDALLARDSRTACFWQSFVNNQAAMSQQFSAAFFKVINLGQPVATMINCTEVIPQPPAFTGTVTFPPLKTLGNIDGSCATTPYPNLATQPGTTALTVKPIPTF